MARFLRIPGFVGVVVQLLNGGLAQAMWLGAGSGAVMGRLLNVDQILLFIIGYQK